jgi:glutamyl-tRNA reductase
MDRLAAIGLSWRHDDLSRVALFTAPEERRGATARALAERLGAEELVYLATCNRVEIVFVPPRGMRPAEIAALRGPAFHVLSGRAPTPGETERTFRAWSGEGAVEHAFLVAAGLDSARLGETEITGQVRRAVELARAEGLVGRTLDALFEEALRLARRVRSETELGSGRTSLAELALEAVRDRLARGRGTVALVGVSPMTERAGLDLAAEGVELVVANRTLARAQELAARLAPHATARACTLDELRAAPPALAALISATGAPDAVLGAAALERIAAAAPPGTRPLAVDLAVPPDVDPDAAARFGVERVGMDELTQRAAATRDSRQAAAADARLRVDEALDRWRRARAERALAPVVTALQTHYQDTASAGLERLFRRELSGVGPAERAALERWVQALARRFAHLPAAGLREIAAEHGREAVESFLRRADADLARALEHGSAEARRAPTRGAPPPGPLSGPPPGPLPGPPPGPLSGPPSDAAAGAAEGGRT